MMKIKAKRGVAKVLNPINTRSSGGGTLLKP